MSRPLDVAVGILIALGVVAVLQHVLYWISPRDPLI